MSIVGFAFVYGLSAREAGFTPLDALAMSSIAFAGAAQFAAVGYVAGGLPLAGIVLLTGLLNARHLLYSAALRPWMRDVPVTRRAVMAHFLTDENFALVMAHFRRIGRTDERAYWMSALLFTFIPWNLATLAGVHARRRDPRSVAIRDRRDLPGGDDRDGGVLITGRRELVAAVAAVAIGVPVRPGCQPGGRDRGRRTARSGGGSARARREGPRGRPDRLRRVRGTLHVPGRPDERRRRRPTADTDRDAVMTTEIVLLAVPDVRGDLPVARARPAHAWHSSACRRSPPTTCNWSVPAILAALAAVAVMVVVDDDGVPAFHVGVEWVGVFVCLAIVARKGNLLLGLVAAVAIVAIARAVGLDTLAI